MCGIYRCWRLGTAWTQLWISYSSTLDSNLGGEERSTMYAFFPSSYLLCITTPDRSLPIPLNHKLCLISKTTQPLLMIPLILPLRDPLILLTTLLWPPQQPLSRAMTHCAVLKLPHYLPRIPCIQLAPNPQLETYQFIPTTALTIYSWIPLRLKRSSLKWHWS